MTEERGAGGADDDAPDERAARLAALLSVDIGFPARAADDIAGGGPATAFLAHTAADTDDRAAESDDAEEPAVTEPLVDGGVAPPEPARRQLRARPRPSGSDGSSATPAASAGRWRTAVSFGVLVALIVAGGGLAYAGSRIVRNSTEGEVVSRVTAPDAPGYEALVEPTPTLVLFQDSGDGLEAVTVLTLPDPDGAGGGVLLVPKRAVVDLPVFGEGPVEIAYDLGDPRVGAEGVGLLLGTAMAERAVVDDERWADLVGPVAPIVVDNPNELTVDGEVRFPIGEIELDPHDVGPYLAATVEGESDLARLFRHQLFWQAWLGAVAADGSLEAVPGELDTGIGRFVRTIAGGETVVETLPVQPAPEDSYGDEPAFLPRGEAVVGLVRVLVPFPVSPAPGARARVRVLNGTPDTTEATSIAAELTPAGVEIVIVGNHTSLDVGTTTVRYFGDEFRDEAEAIVDILGVGDTAEEVRPSDAVDITVTLGRDYE